MCFCFFLCFWLRISELELLAIGDTLLKLVTEGQAINLEVKTLGKMSMSHIRGPGMDTQLWLPTPTPD